jgi:fumarate reductase iron-sulfur subunit
MSQEMIKVKVFRLDPSVDKEPRYETYEVPWAEGLSAMNALDYIYQSLDSTLAYYDHAGCDLGICGQCTGRINGKPGLFCQTPIRGETTLEPISRDRVLRDLVTMKSAEVGVVTQEGEKRTREDIGSVSIPVRREIEALIAAPLIRAYMEEFGQERALEVARKVVKSLALESGKMMSAFAGGTSLEHLAKVTPLFSMGGALEIDMVDATPSRIAINVTRCRYAEMYKEHGLDEFGYLLSCGRDFALMEGFNPKIKFGRTQTIMEGADFCDFRFTVEEE